MKIKIKFGTLAMMVIGLAVTIFVGLSDVPNEGVSLLFLLPLSFSLTALFFTKEYEYGLHSFGLGILYVSLIVRYVVTPVLIVLGGSMVSTIRATPEDYRYAIIVELFELIVVMLTIKFVWPRHLERTRQMKERFDYDPGRSDFRLSWTGLVFLVLMTLLVLSRGHLNNIISHLSTWFTRVDSKEVLFTYDMMAFNIVKTAVFIMIVSLMKTVYEKTSLRVLPVTVSLAAALANTMFFEYRERTDLAVLFIASFFVLFFAFPKYRKPFSVVFGLGGIIIVALVFMEGSLRYEVGASMSTVDLADYSKVAELYTTGPSVIANARMNYAFMKSQVGLRTILMDIINSCDVFSTIPFLRFIPNLVNVRTSVEIYVSTIGGYAYIIPNHNLVSLYVGDALCWIVEPLFIIVNIKLLGWFERKIYRLNDLMQVYAIYSIVTMVATGVFCNNLQLMLHSFSSLPLWLLIFSYVNSIGNKTKYSGVASNPKPAKVSYE